MLWGRNEKNYYCRGLIGGFILVVFVCYGMGSIAIIVVDCSFVNRGRIVFNRR